MNKSNKNVLLLSPFVFKNETKVYDIKFNPCFDSFSICDLGGIVSFYKNNKTGEDDKNQVKLIKSINASNDSIMSICYSEDGQELYGGTSEKELFGIKNGKRFLKKTDAHKSALSKVHFFKSNLLATGDTSGKVKIWDVRQRKKVFLFKEQTEDITDIAYSASSDFLLSTSIDGTLAVFDLRGKENKFKLYALSDCIEDELHCLKIVEHGKKVVCGTSEGPLAIFSWDWFGDIKDRILGHPGSINCMDKYDENCLITGCEDGNIRIVNLFTKNVDKVIGDTKKSDIIENKQFKDIESLSLDNAKSTLGVISNLNCVKIYDISGLKISDGYLGSECESDESEAEEEESYEKNNIPKNRKIPGKTSNKKASYSENSLESGDDSVEEEHEEVSEEEDISEESDNKLVQKNTKKVKTAKATKEKKAKKVKKLISNSSKISVESVEGNEDNNEHKNENDSVTNSNQSNQDSDFSDSDSDQQKKTKKQDKSLKLSKIGKKSSEWLIEKERRKDFFNDL